MENAKLDPVRMSLDKWEMYKALKDMNVQKVHLPETGIATQENVIRFLNQFEKIYVKPVGTWGGRQIVRVRKQNRNFEWQEQGHAPITFKTEEALRERFTQTYGESPSIVQAAAPIRNLHGRLFDVRLLMQRDVEDEWIQAGTVVRIGGKGSIVSNVEISRGEVVGFGTLCKRIRLSRQARRQLEQRLKQTGLTICKALEEYRHFNEIGIDFGLGNDNTLWIFEVNTDDTIGGPSHELFAKLTDKRLYKEIEARAAAVRDNTLKIFMEQLF